MNIGLTGGIASGKTRLEDKFKEQGFLVFDTDHIEFALRDENLDVLPAFIRDDASAVELIRKLSGRVSAQLRILFPELYDSSGDFDRNQLLRYINDDQNGTLNHLAYSAVLNAASAETYCSVRTSTERPLVFSSGMLIERGNLTLVDTLYLIEIEPETQIRNLICREATREAQLSESDAMKAIKRQYPFPFRLELAQKTLGEDGVVVVKYDAEKPEIPLQAL